MFLTFDANEHELVERQRAVVGHNFGGFHTAQVDLAEVLLAGETRQGHVGQVCSGVFRHLKKKEEKTRREMNRAELTHCVQSSLFLDLIGRLANYNKQSRDQMETRCFLLRVTAVVFTSSCVTSQKV